jgi:hypothetical protein
MARRSGVVGDRRRDRLQVAAAVIYPVEIIRAPACAFLPLLVEGWRLPDVVEVADVGGYAVLLWRPALSRACELIGSKP